MSGLKNLKKIHQANFKFSFKDKILGNYFFYFDIDKEIILDASFEAEANLPLNSTFDKLIEINKNKSINYILENNVIEDFRNDNDFDIAHTVIVQNFLKYKGLFVQKSDSDLICRCFGITKNEINELSLKTESYFEFSQNTQASLGCRSCKNDVIHLYLESKKDSRRFLDIPNSQWVTKCQDLLNQFLETTTFDFPVQINVVKFKAGVVQVDLVENFNNFKFAFEQYLNQELDKKLTIVNFSF